MQMSKEREGSEEEEEREREGMKVQELGLLNSLLGFHFPSPFIMRFCQGHCVPGARGLPLSAATAINETEL